MNIRVCWLIFLGKTECVTCELPNIIVKSSCSGFHVCYVSFINVNGIIKVVLMGHLSQLRHVISNYQHPIFYFLTTSNQESSIKLFTSYKIIIS